MVKPNSLLGAPYWKKKASKKEIIEIRRVTKVHFDIVRDGRFFENEFDSQNLLWITIGIVSNFRLNDIYFITNLIDKVLGLQKLGVILEKSSKLFSKKRSLLKVVFASDLFLSHNERQVKLAIDEKTCLIMSLMAW